MFVMKFLRYILYILALASPLLVGLGGCKSAKNHKSTTDIIVDSLQELVVDGSQPYQASATRLTDIINTRLEVKFDWEKARMNASALIEAHPYFHPIDKMELDAKGMDILEVSLKGANGNKPLKYTYDSLKLNITLDRKYKRTETYSVFIKYVAKPEEMKLGGSEAISSDKGLYFINRFGTDKSKPKQLWTQGETEAASCWFPTVDKPNERMTQEIYITVDTSFVTLSNGILIYSSDNPDGTRTDCWKQTLPAAPYLSMMAVGKWKIVKDKWRDFEVNYYMEPEFAPYTKNIFGKTPAMMEFYSKTLGVDYPWEKFSQVIVRDYVSGAMENTTAVIHGDFFNQTDREMLDGDNETTVAHELFHQWFGDYVTCESWSNLPLNESFATYGEYLWLEHEYGRDEADYHGKIDLGRYLNEADQKNENLIRFYYNDREDMFDMHSYAKGGRVLHMLRYYLGDEAFFEGLKTYLTENKFQSVEIHNLRLAMEKVSGEDLNWFFNQWFLNKGYPEINIQGNYDSLSHQYGISITQIQNLKENPVYKLPMDVDVYYKDGSKERTRIWVTKAKDFVAIAVKENPILVNVDAEKQLLCVRHDFKSEEEAAELLTRGPLYMDRYYGIMGLADYIKVVAKDSLEKKYSDLIKKATEDKHYGIRAFALKNLPDNSFSTPDEFKSFLMKIIKTDSKSLVRAAALKKYSERFSAPESLPFLNEIALADKSYKVQGEALNAIFGIDNKEGVDLARKLSPSARGSLVLNIGIILADKGDENDKQFFENGINQITENNSKYVFAALIGGYASKQNPATIKKILPRIENIARNESTWYIRLASIQGISEIVLKLQTKIDDLGKDAANEAAKTELTSLKKEVETLLADIKEKEADPKVKRIIGK